MEDKLSKMSEEEDEDGSGGEGRSLEEQYKLLVLAIVTMGAPASCVLAGRGRKEAKRGERSARRVRD